MTMRSLSNPRCCFFEGEGLGPDMKIVKKRFSEIIKLFIL